MTHAQLLYGSTFKLFFGKGYPHSASEKVAERAVFLYERGAKAKDAIDQSIKEGVKIHSRDS